MANWKLVAGGELRCMNHGHHVYVFSKATLFGVITLKDDLLLSVKLGTFIHVSCTVCVCVRGREGEGDWGKGDEINGNVCVYKMT